MGKRSKKTQRKQLFGTISLWLTYIAIACFVAFIVQNNFGLGFLPSGGVGFGVTAIVIIVSEILDRKLGWAEKAKKASEPLTAPEFIKANPDLGHRAMIREFVEQGGNTDDIKAELNK